MKILIVDDDEVTRLSLSRVLSTLEAECVPAADGEEALALLESGLRPTVCCCDLVMPRLGGMDLMQRLRSHAVWKSIPFVLVSAASDRATVEKAVAAGIAGYIVKPFSASQTRATVQRVLRERRQARGEHWSATRRRLQLTMQQLEEQLRKAAAAARACAAAPDVESLRRLGGSTLLLGLSAASALLHDVLAEGTPEATRSLAATEVAHQAEDQLASLLRLESLALWTGEAR